MPPSPRPDLIAAPVRSGATERLLSLVQRRLACVESGAPWQVERVEVEADLGDPVLWLAAQSAPERHYWHGRSTSRRSAGIGVADAVADAGAGRFDVLQRRFDALGGAPAAARYYGGLRFAPSAPEAEEWKPFSAMRFVLPRVEYVVADGRGVLAANLVVPRDGKRSGAVLAEIRALVASPVLQARPLPLPVARTDVPSPAGWRQGIEEALDAFARTDLEKVVLARRACYDFDAELDPFVLAQVLEEETPACFHFLIQPAPGVAFVGASPERLFRQDGTRLVSEAVAGTRPRGSSASSDARLRRELFDSDKDRREHEYVRAHIQETLAPLAETLDADAEPSDMPLARGRHLYSGVRATLQPGTSPVEVLRSLHPTPAVGGTPTPDALAMIEATEPFDRGWYAGPVGWIGADAAEFAVGIRSGLVQERETGATLSLYSGAGIVQGSEAGAEWDEIEQKIGDFARVLGLDA